MLKKNVCWWVWRNGLAIKDTCCSFEGPKLSSQNPLRKSTADINFSLRGSDILVHPPSATTLMRIYSHTDSYLHIQLKIKQTSHTLVTLGDRICSLQILKIHRSTIPLYKVEQYLPMTCIHPTYLKLSLHSLYYLISC